METLRELIILINESNFTNMALVFYNKKIDSNNVNNLIIDNDEYIIDIKILIAFSILNYNLDKTSCKFIINNLYDLVFFLSYKFISYDKKINVLNNLNINDLNLNGTTIDNTVILPNELTIEVIKFLEYKNFNFNSIELYIFLHTLRNEDTIKYIINNDLYDFQNANKFYILKHCNSDTLLFWINYLNIDIYQEYQEHSLYYYLTCNNRSNNVSEKCFLVYEKYNLLITDNDIINISNNSFYEFIIFYYDIDKFASLKQENIKLILTKFQPFTEILKRYMSIIDLIDNSDIDLIIIIIININDYYMRKDVFIKVIEKLNIDIVDIINYLKIHAELKILIEFYYLYYKYYNSDITNYTNYIFSNTNYDLIYNQIQSINMFNVSKFKLLVELMDKYYLN